MVLEPEGHTGAWGFIATVIISMGRDRRQGLSARARQHDIVPLPIASRAVLDRVIGGDMASGFEDEQYARRPSVLPSAPVKLSGLIRDTNACRSPHQRQRRRNPNAAKLFVDFMASRTGQNIFREPITCRMPRTCRPKSRAKLRQWRHNGDLQSQRCRQSTRNVGEDLRGDIFGRWLRRLAQWSNKQMAIVAPCHGVGCAAITIPVGARFKHCVPRGHCARSKESSLL